MQLDDLPIMFEWFIDFFHIFSIIKIYTQVELFTLNLETIIQMLHIALIRLYIKTPHNNLMFHIYI
jgi:hypothetical protein